MKYLQHFILAATLMLAACSAPKTDLAGVITGECTVYVQSYSATCHGIVETDGGSPVIERGICYIAGNGTPTFANNHVAAGSGKGSFQCQLSNLQSTITYSYCAYAVNAKGTAYGTVRTFIMSESSSQGEGEVIPQDGVLSVSQFKRLQDNNSNWYTVTGVVYDITDASKGSMHIYDNTGMLPVCIVNATKQSSLASDNSFGTLGISLNDSITLCGVKTSKNGVPVMACGYLVKNHGQMIPDVYSLALEPRETTHFEIDNSYELSIFNSGGWGTSVEVEKQDVTLSLSCWSQTYNPSAISKIGTGNFYVYYGLTEPYQAILPCYGYHLNGYNSKGYISGSNLINQASFEQFALYFIIGGKMVVSEINGKAKFEFDLKTQNGSTITGSWTGTPELITK